jgi:hypothetical protein
MLPAWSRQYATDPRWKAWADVPWELRDFPLIVAQHDYLRWVRRVLMVVDRSNFCQNDAQLTDNLGRFDDWYNGPGQMHYGHLSEFTALKPAHEKIQKIGAQIIFLCEANLMDEIHAACSELQAQRGLILKLLDALSAAIFPELLVGRTSPCDELAFVSEFEKKNGRYKNPRSQSRIENAEFLAC